MTTEINFKVKYESSYLYAICNDIAYIHNMPKLTGPLDVTVYAQCESDGPFGDYHIEPAETVAAIERVCEPSEGADAKACRIMFIGVVAGYISNLCACGDEKISAAAEDAWSDRLADREDDR